MGREKFIRNIRKLRSTINPNPNGEMGGRNPNPNNGEIGGTNPNPSFDEGCWGYWTEDQLEELLLKNLEFLYNEAISKLVSLGYDEDVALESILRNGHCYGSMDVITNVLQNAIGYINSSSCKNGNSDERELVFANLRQLEEYSLADMVCLLRQVRPELSKGDAMWCLLLSDLHVGRATTVKIPVLSPDDSCKDESVSSNGGGMSGLCKFHRGWGFGGDDLRANGLSYDAETMNFDATLTTNIECLKRFNLSPSMESLLKRNVAIFAAGFRANSKAFLHSHSQSQSQSQSHACPSSSSSNELPQSEEPKDSLNSDVVSSILGSFGNMSINEKLDGVTDPKNEIILNMMHQIRELEGQVKERREWAHEKAMQAARKLSNDLTELNMLRMEREETLQLKKGKQALEDATMKRLSEMENALRKASGQVDRVNAAVRLLETKNAEIRAEMEASKLSASESVTTCLEVTKREKKYLKRLMAWEKQKSKWQEEVAEERQKIVELQRQMQLSKEAQKETEIKWRQEVKAKELAIARVEEERRAKEAAKATVKGRQEALHRKIEMDFQRHKDDIKRLELDLSQFKASAELTQLSYPLNTRSTGDLDTAKMPKGTNARIHHELHKLQESSQKEVSHDRECLICMKDEASIVFLPCAHQVLCVNCNEGHAKAKTTCPCCSIKIEQRIHVYGASS
ncbi:MND1-interacting protein 1-like isoform X2 [Tasmannia lanceolata]|uniref:MND1-interacting protein 1-like isoform X2 n=1 Tax=Tasmannia lanceolata TaxID=3420 RepID=UPI004062B4B4